MTAYVGSLRPQSIRDAMSAGVMISNYCWTTSNAKIDCFFDEGIQGAELRRCASTEAPSTASGTSGGNPKNVNTSRITTS